MDALTDLKNIWHTAKTDSLPTSAEMLQLIKRFRRQRLKKKWVTIVAATLLSLLMLVILIVAPFKQWTTYAGGAMIIASGALLAGTNIKSLKRFYQLDDSSNRDFLAFIEQTRLNQVFYYKKTQVRILFLCSTGVIFYLYESVKPFPALAIGLYVGYLAYLLFIWLVLRPYFYKKNAAKLDIIRQRLEKISNQLKEYEA